MRRVLTLAVLALAACGGTTAAATTTTTAPPMKDLVVRVTAYDSGTGCSGSVARSGLTVGTGEQIRVVDGHGGLLGVAPLSLSRGAGACDWTATVSVAQADFVDVTAGGELATFTRTQLDHAGWRVHVDIGVTGEPKAV